MGIRIDELGGTDWSDGNVLDALDLNDTMLAVMQPAAQTNAELAYKGQQVTGWENKGSSAAEKYTTAEGLQGTVNTVSTDAVFNVDRYLCKFVGNGSNNNSSVSTLSTIQSGSLALNLGIGGVALNNSLLKSFYLNTGVSGATVFKILASDETILYTQIISTTGLITLTTPFLLEKNKTYYFVIDDAGGSWTFIYDDTPTWNDSVDFDLNTGHSGNTANSIAYNIDYIITETVDYTNSTIVHDTNTLPIDDETNSFCVHLDAEIPTDTSIDVEISDGIPLIDFTEAFYEFDGDATDETGNGYNGVPTSITYTTGVIGQASVYNGTNSVILSNNGILRDVAGYVSLFFNADDVSGNQTMFASSAGTNSRCYIQLTGSDLGVSMGDQNTISTGITVVPGTWYHVVLTWNGNNYQAYVDNVLKIDSTFTLGVSFSSWYGFGSFNQNGGALTNYFAGKIDLGAVGISSCDASKVNYLYNGGAGRSYADLSGEIFNKITLPVNPITKKTGVVPRGALLNVSNLILNLKLNTTNTSVTPYAKGWGLVKL